MTKNKHKFFIVVIALALIIPIAFALQTGFLEVKTLCLNGDCRVVWPNGDVTFIFGGGNIDVNANSGAVLVSFDDGNFLGFSHNWPADQNFSNLQADFFFGDGSGLTNLALTTDTTLDTNTGASAGFRATNNSWSGVMTWESIANFEDTVTFDGITQLNFRNSGSNILSPAIGDLDITANDQLMLKSSGVDIVEVISEGVLVHVGDFNIFQGQANVFDANITNLTVTDTQGVDGNYTGTFNVDLNLTVQKDIILQQGQRICGDIDCNAFITHDGTGWIFQS